MIKFYPLYHFFFFFADDRVQIVTISTLTLSPVLSSDAGTYECEADNTAAGFDRQSVELQVQGTSSLAVFCVSLLQADWGIFVNLCFYIAWPRIMESDNNCSQSCRRLCCAKI